MVMLNSTNVPSANGPSTHPCPKCGRPCSEAGELTSLGQPVACRVFECEACAAPVLVGGVSIGDAPFIFAVTDAGVILNAQTFEPI